MVVGEDGFELVEKDGGVGRVRVEVEEVDGGVELEEVDGDGVGVVLEDVDGGVELEEVDGVDGDGVGVVLEDVDGGRVDGGVVLVVGGV